MEEREVFVSSVVAGTEHPSEKVDPKNLITMFLVRQRPLVDAAIITEAKEEVR